MGASESSEQKEQWMFKDLAASDIQQIKQFTKGSLTSKEIHLFHYAFMHKMKIIPKQGKITRDMFILFFREIGEEWLTEKLLLRIDKDNQGIDFKEFLNWFYLLSRGTIEERRKLIFSLYDLDNKLVIRRNDVKKFVGALAWRIKLSCLENESPLDMSDDTPSVRRRLLQSDEEVEKHTLPFHLKIPHLGHDGKEEDKEKDIKEKEKASEEKEKKKNKLGKKFDEFKETIEDMITRKEMEFENKVDNLRLALDDPRIKKKLGILYQMVDDFFEDSEVLTFQEYEEKYFVNIGSAVFTGFGILDYCYHKMFEPMESTIMEDIVSPPAREGYLLKRRAGLATSMDLLGNFDKRYFRLEQGFLFVFANKPNDKKDKPQKVIPLLNTSISVKSAFDQRDEYTFYIRTVLPTGETWSRYLKTRDEGEKFDWAYDIICNVQEIPENRYHAFVPPRDYVAARWFVDGKDTFSFMCDCLRLAKKEIFITDWWLTPEVYLKRDYNSKDFGLETRLDILLKKKAEEGVAVYVLLWNETKIALELNSLYTKNKLEKLHRNITVLRHPDNWPLYWAHHQKSVIVDQDLAFVGGLDLCYGRWDSPEHSITDTCQLRTQWPGKDYSNESIKVTTGIDRPFDDAFDRMTTPRMGWHDVHCCVDGQAARDIAYNFIQRWNHHVIGTSTSHLFPKTFPPRLFLDENGQPSILNIVTSTDTLRTSDDINVGELKNSDSMPAISVTGLDAPQISEMGLIGVAPPQEYTKTRSNSLNNNNKKPQLGSPPSSPTVKPTPPTHRRSRSVDTQSWSSKSSSLDIPSSRGSRNASPGNSFRRARAESMGVNPNAPPSFSPMCRVQVCRSLSLWSGGLFTETSIYQAYIDLIATAEHYIYIENQFFISSLAGNGVQNRIGEAILHRIRKAIVSNQVFRVFIVLPCFPTGGSWKESASIQYVMKWQYATINRGGHSLLEQIQQEFPKVNPEDYIIFCSLRNHGEILGNPVTELIYVHSKLMIVDDRIAVIGSANINDRSMVGDRDSEIGVIIEDGQRVDTKMNGQHYKGRRFAHELRMNLFREHLGVYNNDNALLDPTIEAFYKGVWVKIAKWNNQLYCELFHDIPNDSIESFAELMRRDTILKAWLEDPVRKAQTLDFLRGIQGHLTMFPYQFLREESFSSAAIESWLSEEIFQ